MFKRIALAVCVFVLLVMAAPVAAEGPVNPQHSDPTWQATYWNNTDLSGTAVLSRAEANVNYNWGAGSPQSGTVSADNFSARWTRYIDVTPGTYTFSMTSDDGMRLWVDGELILDAWYEHPALTLSAQKYMGPGHHLIKIEYYEKGGLAEAQVSWQLGTSTPPPTGNWYAEYFNDITLGGSPVLTRNEAEINYAWGTGSPAPGTVSADRFSARWTQSINLPAGMYTFLLTVDDGARLWVNGHLLVDAWIEQAATTYQGELYLPGGAVTIEVQYFENYGEAVAKLSWTKDGVTPDPDPAPAGTVVVDDRDAGFMKGGAAAGWRYEAEGYNGTLTWTYNNYNIQPNYNWARWYPKLGSGNYEVYVHIPERYSTTAKARYWINHNGVYTLRVINQSTSGSQWVSLGTYYFNGLGGEYVSLADVTYEAYRTRLIAYDAVKWVPR
ncbi:MAG: PA14 domain-containing protein [Anaerolineae bacterium]|nr:PA14 domain-containing protein [Anaerolineae bacterium]